MCWSPKVKTPAVTAQIQAPAPVIQDTAKGVQFGDEEPREKSGKEQSGIKGLTITPNTENSNSQATSTTMGSTSVGANIGTSAVKKSLAAKKATSTTNSKGGV